jgi:hypothetical protein
VTLQRGCQRTGKYSFEGTTIPPDIFSRDVYKPFVVIKEALEPVPNTSTPPTDEPEAIRIDGEQGEATPVLDWQTPYLEYLLRGNYLSARPRLGDWLGMPRHSYYLGKKRSCTDAVPRESSSDASTSVRPRTVRQNPLRGLRAPHDAPNPHWKRLQARVLLANSSCRCN